MLDYRIFLSFWKRFQSSHASVWAGSLTLHLLLGLPALFTVFLWCLRLVATPVQVEEWVTLIAGTLPTLAVRTTIHDMLTATSSAAAPIIAFAIAIFAASNLFSHLSMVLREIWNLPTAPNKTGGFFSGLVIRQLRAFLPVVIFGGLLIALVVAVTALRALAPIFSLAFSLSPLALQILTLVGFTVLAAIFSGAFFYYFSQGKFSRGQYVKSGLLTALLLTLGQILLGAYFQVFNIGNGFGVLGSVAVLLLWMYYTTLVFLFGATTICAFSDPEPKSGKRTE